MVPGAVGTDDAVAGAEGVLKRGVGEVEEGVVWIVCWSSTICRIFFMLPAAPMKHVLNHIRKCCMSCSHISGVIRLMP